MDMEIFESGKKKLRVQKYLDTCGLGLRMNRMHRTQFEHSRLDLLSLDPRGLTIYHVKLVQSIALLEQKRFDLRSLSPALRNLWLLLVLYFGGKADVKLGRFISLPPPREFCFLACHTEIQKDLDLK